MRWLIICFAIFVLFLQVESQAQTPADSLQVRILQLENEKTDYQTRITELEAENVKAKKLVDQERRNIRYLFVAYAIIWILIIGFIFRHFLRVKHLTQEVGMLKSMLNEHKTR